MSHPKPFTLVWVVSTCTAIFAPAIALAQPIIPNSDGTGTLVTPEGDRFNIHGGQTSGDGTNLFHSFQEFGLDAGQTANFQSSPEIQNILGRITGGNASLIDGLIEVTGSNANLFLMNPAGIVFGDNAQLNVPASFTATTATGIGLDGGWFHTFGSNDYTALVGTPNAFDFAAIAPAGIVNRGNLTVADGANLSLFGGTVVSTGTLQAEGGEISVAAVPGENLLRLNAEGNILSLEVSPATSSFSLLNPRSLPELLTLGESIADADTLVVNPDGTVALTGSRLRVEDGDIVVVGGENSEPNLRSGSAILAADRNLTLTETQLSTTGDLTLLAGDTLQVRDSIANRVLTEAGGDLSLRGTRGIDILALNHPQTPFVSGGDLSLASGGFISGDAHYSTGGNFSILTLDGEPGEFFSLIDPIIFANGDVTFGDYMGPSLVIEATGEITTGNITINGIDPNIADEPVLILRAGRTPTPITLAAGGTTTEAGTVFSASSTAATPPGIEAGNILIDAGGIGGLTFLEAPGNITAGSIESNGGTIFLNSIAGSISTTGLLDSTAATGDSGLITLQADGDITASGLDASSDRGNPGDVTLYSVTGDIDVDAIDASSVDGEGGEVLLFSQEGAIAAGDIDTSSDNSIGGNVTFQGFEDVTTASVDASGISGGMIDLRSTNGGVASRGILTSGGENITLQAASDVSAVDIFSNSGEILLNSSTGAISTTGTLDSTADTGSGTIQLAADGDITANDFNTSNNDGNAADITLFSQTGNIGTGAIDASSVDGEGGEVLLFSQEGAINAGDIDTSSDNSIGGNVTFQGLENVTTANIDASGSGGEIDLRSTNGGVASSGTLTSGGEDVSLQGSGNVTVADLFSNGGEILLNSTGGEITTTGTLDSTVDSGSGTIQLAADGDITANNFNTSSRDGNAADITLFSQTGNIGTGEIDASSVSGDGGTVQLHAESGSTSSGNIDTSSNNGNSGDVTLFGEDGVTTASIDASGLGGEIDLRSTNGGVASSGTLTSGGEDVTLQGSGNVAAAGIVSNGGEILLNSTAGEITTTGTLDSTADTGSGSIELAAQGNITADRFDTSSNNGNAGDVTLYSATGNISTRRVVNASAIDSDGGTVQFHAEFGSITAGNIDTSSENGNSGDVTLFARNDLTTARIDASGSGGEIDLRSTNGGITSSGTLTSSGDNITLHSRGGLTTQDITSGGGTIELRSSNGGINTTNGTIDSSRTGGNGGDVTLHGQGNLATQDVTSGGGAIELWSSNSGINTTNGTIDSSGTGGNGGDVTLHGRGNLATQDITSDGGAIELRSSHGRIDTTNGTIDSSGTGGNGGDVTLHGRGNLTTQDITSDGGNISLTSSNSISSNGTIDSSGTGANGGNIDLLSSRSIDTQDVTSGGGNIKLKTSAQNSTIDTRGATIDSRAAGQTGTTRTAASFRGNPGRPLAGTIRIGRVISGSGNRVSLKVPLRSTDGDTVTNGNSPNPPSAPSQVVALTAPSIAGTTGTLNAPNIAGTTGTLNAPNIAGTTGTLNAPNIAGTTGTLNAPNITDTTGTIAPPDITVMLPDIVPPPVAPPPSIANADIPVDNAGNVDNATPSISDSGNATTPVNSLATNSQSTSISIEATSTIETGSGTDPTVSTPIATPIASIPTETGTETVAANPDSGTTSIAPIPTETVATPIETPIASTPTDAPVTATPTEVALLPDASRTSTPATPETNSPGTNANTSIVNSGANPLDLVSSANLEIRNSTPNNGRSLQTLAREAGNCLEATGLLGSEAGTALEAVPTDYTEAIACYQTNLEFARKSGDRPREQYTLYNLATSYYAIGNYAEALSYHQQGLEVATSEGNLLEQAKAWKGVGDTYGAIGSFDRAIVAYESGLEIARSMDSVVLEGELLRNLGQVYYARQDYSTARELQQQSLVLAIQAENRTAQANALNALGLTRYKLTDYDAAISLQQQSLTIARELGDRTLEGRALENLGLTYYAREEYDTAIDYHQQSLAIARQNSDRHGEARALNNLGDALDRAGQPEESEETLLAAIETWESLRKNLGDRDLDRVAIFETQETTYSTLQENLVSRDRFDRALEMTERGRSRAFVDLLARRQGGQAQESAESEIQPPNIDEIRAIAREQNSTLVSYSVIQEVVETEGVRQLQDKELYIWVVQPSGDVAFRRSSLESVVAERGSLQKLVTDSRCFTPRCLRRKGVSRNTSDRPLNRDLQQLYQLTIEPIADLLPQNPEERVTLIPHRSMFLIPFPALQDASGQYLIEQQTISTAPSIQVLALTHQQQQRNAQRNLGGNLGEALVVGNPTMPSVAFSAGATPYPLDPLPGAESEAIAIAEMLGTEALTGDGATEKAIVEGMSRSRIVHLATHGLLEDFQGLGLPGAIATAPSDSSDGLLASGEIFDLDLSAELVVLSACHTGQGRISEDGVVGLSRSFMAAGVPSLVVSLWAVPDAPTSDLMVEFYRQLERIPDKAQALRQAMLSTLDQYPSPENWAAFTLMGES